jgi:hypothetical protein
VRANSIGASMRVQGGRLRECIVGFIEPASGHQRETKGTGDAAPAGDDRERELLAPWTEQLGDDGRGCAVVERGDHLGTCGHRGEPRHVESQTGETVRDEWLEDAAGITEPFELAERRGQDGSLRGTGPVLGNRAFAAFDDFAETPLRPANVVELTPIGE